MTASGKRKELNMILDEKKLINECLSRSWTQMVLRSKSGVSLTTISKAYNGKPISDKSAKKIADALVINLDLLIKKGV
ncbi:MAG: hypothetical protein ACLT8P_05865 [Holdemanella porci]|uniref:hypothetical protein n=1 Tax=Holdemanella porci TaxID=2652276 RepID=UPI003995D3D5